jgi:ribosomal protein L11 methyltransferase
MIFEAGFSGFEEHTVAGRTRYTAFYTVAPDHNPLEALRKSFASIRAYLGHEPARILAVENVPDADWEAKWREGLGAVEAGKRLVVRPSWVDYENREERIEIIIDPKMAFGTGGHATTHLCLEVLERIDPAGKTVLDAGCGSGVLSIAAAKLGAERVFGFDNDPFSIDNATENILLNNVGDRVRAVLADLNEINPEPADILLANLISGVLIAFLDKFRLLLNPGGIAVFSGILAEEEAHFTGHLPIHGFRTLSVERRDEWIAVLADVPDCL